MQRTSYSAVLRWKEELEINRHHPRAEASAIIYSIVETCKLNNLNIFYYISHLLTEIPKHMDDTNLDFLEDALPWSEKLPEKNAKADCRDEIALPAAMLAWLKIQKTKNEEFSQEVPRFLCSLFVKARVVYRLRFVECYEEN